MGTLWGPSTSPLSLVLAGHPDLESPSCRSASLPSPPPARSSPSAAGLVWSGLCLAHLAVGRPRKTQGYPSTPGPEHPWTSLVAAPASSLPGSSQAQQQQQQRSEAQQSTAKPSPAGWSPSPTELDVVSPISLHNTTCTRSLIFRDHNPLLSAQPAALHPTLRYQIQKLSRPACTLTTPRTRL